jgi:hypothetical protein
MFKALTIAALSVGLLTVPVLADGKIYVQLPDLTSYTGAEAEDFLREVVLANVVSSNCPGYEVTDEEWSLLTDSADLLAYGQLKLDTGTYDEQYYAPAFAELDEPGTCDSAGPKVQPIIERLIEDGGSREALPDQDVAYEEWRAIMDELMEEAEGGEPAPSGDGETNKGDKN